MFFLFICRYFYLFVCLFIFVSFQIPNEWNKRHLLSIFRLIWIWHLIIGVWWKLWHFCLLYICTKMTKIDTFNLILSHVGLKKKEILIGIIKHIRQKKINHKDEIIAWNETIFLFLIYANNQMNKKLRWATRKQNKKQ